MSPPAPRPRVLVTRARNQGSVLAEHLRALGAEPILLPLIAIEPPSSFAVLDAALGALSSFSWLIFTSGNAVAATVARAAGQSISLGEQQGTGPRLAAIGAPTAAALTQHGLAVDLTSPEPVAESLAATLVPFARTSQGKPARFLLPRAEQARDALPDTLIAAGAEVTVAPAYRNTVPAEALGQLRRLFTRPAQPPDAIAFTSSSTVGNLFTLLAEAGLQLPPSTLLASIGPITSATLRGLAHAPHIEAGTATVAALAEAVVRGLESWRTGRPG